MKNPLALVKEKFGEKSKLVAAVEKFVGDDLWVARTNKSKGLAHVPNAKLLRLHATFTAVQEKFGTRAKMIDAIMEIEKRAKDAGLKTRLLAFPVPRLWDMYKSAEKRAEHAKTVAAKAVEKAAKSPAPTAAKKAAPKAKAAPKSKA